MITDSKIAAAAAKIPFHMLPLRWLSGLARAFAYGAKKHGRENYYNSADDPETCDRYMGGVLRHIELMQTWGGSYTMASCVSTDDESGLPHIDHAIAGLVMLRARMCKAKALSADPGVGNDPPKQAPKPTPAPVYMCTRCKQVSGTPCYSCIEEGLPL